MKNKRLASTLITLFLATLALLIWRFEIIYIVGWSGLAWLKTPLYSPIIISILVAIAAIVPFNLYLNDELKRKSILTFFLLSVFGYIAYVFGRLVISDYYSAYYNPFLYFPDNIYLMLSITPLVVALVFYLIIRFLLVKVPWWYPVSVLFGIGMTFLFSANFDVETVKTGAPFFWIVFFTGAASIMTTERMKNNQEKKLTMNDNKDILDSEIVLHK